MKIDEKEVKYIAISVGLFTAIILLTANMILTNI